MMGVTARWLGLGASLFRLKEEVAEEFSDTRGTFQKASQFASEETQCRSED
jgi:hypothetical protein